MSLKKAYLTFDDGPSVPYTSQILEILKKEEIKATFFVCGKNVERNPDLLKNIVKEGHSIGNHSYSHSRKLTRLGVWSEISKANFSIEKVLGFTPKLYRAPYGEFVPWIYPYTKFNGMRWVRWGTKGKDWEEKDPIRIANNVLKKDKDNLIILLHDGDITSEKVNRSATVEALSLIIDELRARGYGFFPLI